MRASILAGWFAMFALKVCLDNDIPYFLVNGVGGSAFLCLMWWLESSHYRKVGRCTGEN